MQKCKMTFDLRLKTLDFSLLPLRQCITDFTAEFHQEFH
jgi:hypothetical protein